MEFTLITGLAKECSGVNQAECAIKRISGDPFTKLGKRAVGALQMRLSSAIDEEPIPSSNPLVEEDRCTACGKIVLTISDESGPLALYTTPIDDSF